MGPIKKKKETDREFKGGAWDLREGDRRKLKAKGKPKPKVKTKAKEKVKDEPERRKGSRRRGFGGVF